MKTTTNSRTSSALPQCSQQTAAETAVTTEHAFNIFDGEVLRHLLAMPDAEWERLRAFGTDEGRFVNHNDIALPHLTRESLVEGFVSIDGISIGEVLGPEYRAKAVEIARVEGRPLYYIEGEGIYVMEVVRESGVPMTRTLWATMPAYPPSW